MAHANPRHWDRTGVDESSLSAHADVVERGDSDAVLRKMPLIVPPWQVLAINSTKSISRSVTVTILLQSNDVSKEHLLGIIFCAHFLIFENTIFALNWFRNDNICTKFHNRKIIRVIIVRQSRRIP